MVKKYSNKITYLSLILSLSILWTHSVNITYYDNIPNGFYFFETCVFSFRILSLCMFFALSGYLFYQNFSFDKIKSKLKSRFLSIVIPYVVWNVIAYLVFVIIYSIPFVIEHTNYIMEPFNFEWLIKNAVFGYHNILWFLRNIIIYTIVTPIIIKIIGKPLHQIILLILLSIYGMLYTGMGYIWYYCFYLFGSIMGLNYKEIVKKNFGKQLKNLSLMFIVVIIMLIANYKQSEYAYMLPVWMFLVACLWVASDYLDIEKEPKWWMKQSFFIYCTHSLILEPLEKLIFIFIGNNAFGAMFDFIFAPSFTLLVIIVMAYILRKNTFVWNLLTGYRGNR